MIVEYLDERIDIRLWSGELGGVFDFDEHNEVEIVPHVVFELDVLFERHRLIVEIASVQSYPNIYASISGLQML